VCRRRFSAATDGNFTKLSFVLPRVGLNWASGENSLLPQRPVVEISREEQGLQVERDFDDYFCETSKFLSARIKRHFPVA
jgi:hypothetical protein